MTPAIRVQKLGKKYRVVRGSTEEAGYRTLRESLAETVAAPLRRLRGGLFSEDSTYDFWALQDVSFEVQAGEAVGIIGRNGAGKTTLLKILSQITKPTTGRAEIHGRVGSLLEVGTGFHPELTGRENVYLNGSILGMTRREIDRKFDEIVAFAEVEPFLETPVKRYSSGMYVRLAFAVAAHLEPEILIVDEVLAVGDAGFQRKCFAKMTEIRQSGRTVLVVSHNLGAVLSICSTAINLEHGRLVNLGAVDRQVAWYLSRLGDVSKQDLAERTDREGDQVVRLMNVEFRDGSDHPITQAICGEELRVVLRCQAKHADAAVDYIALSCWTADGVKLFHVDNTMRNQPMASAGLDRAFLCTIPVLPLPAGRYQLNVALGAHGKLRDHVYAATTLEVLGGDFFRTGRTAVAEGGLVLVNHEWSALA
jgi:lipopolysaccharide transport system ATP-binding protein